ncbi:choline transporter-like protein 1 isoform X3 [Anolis carolinensis]|uniref:choline transporter-like protein 1 isoform X3 n=1 Tax=Anolis carolinensis TaxID=28377 RepID=UPI002F2B2B8E
MATRKQKRGAGEVEVYQGEESSDSEQQTTMSEAMMRYQLELRKLELEAQEKEKQRQAEAQDKEKQRQAEAQDKERQVQMEKMKLEKEIEMRKMEIEWERQKLTLSQPSVEAQPGTPILNPVDSALKRFPKYTKEDVEMQRIELTSLLKMPLCPGDSWCLIDYKWFKKWQRYVGFESWDLYYAGKHDYYPGPIDNSKLVADSETQTLKRYSIEGVDYEVIPIEAWNKLVNWYGCIERQRPIERTVVEYGKYFKYCKVEVYPSESKPSQNNDSVNLVRSQFKPVEDSAEDGGIVNLQKKLSESQLEIHCVAEVNVSPVAEVPIQCRGDTGVEQAEVIGDLEVPVIYENDLFEHRGEINTVIKSNGLKSDCAFTKDLPEKDGNMKLLGANRKNNVVPSKDKKEDGSWSGQTLQIKSSTTKGRGLNASSQITTDSINSVVASSVTANTEHGQQLWPEEDLPQKNTGFGPFELLCAGEPEELMDTWKENRVVTGTPKNISVKEEKKMDILSPRVVADRSKSGSKQRLCFDGESFEDFYASEIGSFNYHQFTFDVLRKYMNYVSQDFLNDSWKFRKRLFGTERVHCVAGKDECNCPQQHVNLWNAPQSETSKNCTNWAGEEDCYELDKVSGRCFGPVYK